MSDNTYSSFRQTIRNAMRDRTGEPILCGGGSEENPCHEDEAFRARVQKAMRERTGEPILG